MTERLNVTKHEPKVVEILEIGCGRGPNTSIYDLSPTMRAKIDAGANTVTIDKDVEALAHTRYGVTRTEQMLRFAQSDDLRGSVRNIFLNNVCGEEYSGIVNDFSAVLLLSGLKNKLTPDGKIIIVENYTPSKVAFLKKVDYRSLGLRAEITTNTNEYRERMKELDIDESPTASEFALFHAQELEIPWDPFVIVLTRLDATSPEPREN